MSYAGKCSSVWVLLSQGITSPGTELTPCVPVPPLCHASLPRRAIPGSPPPR